jgi:hypothetical protein
MENDQRTARIFGVLFLITFVTSIPALALYQPVLDDPAAYIAGGGHDNQIYLGVLLELLLIIANVATAVVVYPILRRQNEILPSVVTARWSNALHRAGIVFVLSACARTVLMRLARRVARGAEGLDVPARARVHRRLGKRPILGYLMYAPDSRHGDGVLGLIGGLSSSRRGSACCSSGRRRHGAGTRDDPGVRVGVVTRHLRRRVGVQTGFSDSLAGLALTLALVRA